MSYMRKEDFNNLQRGDVVTIRGWDEMEREFGLSRYGDIKCLYTFTRDMKYLCNNSYIVQEINHSGGVSLENASWLISREMLKPIDPIIIEASLFDEFLLGN